MQAAFGADIKFLITDLRIFKLDDAEPKKCDQSGACYSHLGMGSIVLHGSSNRVSILTIADLFSNKPEEYCLVDGDDQQLYSFRYANQRDAHGLAAIPIGTYNPLTKSVVATTNSVFQGNKHFHKQEELLKR